MDIDLGRDDDEASTIEWRLRVGAHSSPRENLWRWSRSMP
jgi:hypothetical protein